jgi:2-polyprenyl-3-methyl-5-hydroxy-6-metoxy-1,4-benzoquinol methylase
MSTHKQDWEDLSRVDACWAILSDPNRRFRAWDVEEFFRTGQTEFDEVMRIAKRLGHPVHHGKALDFGCGVGRVTRAMAAYFAECVGVDISDTMIAKAQELNAAASSCTFMLLDWRDLNVFPGNHFDFVYSNIVLQHLPSRSLIEHKIAEFVRMLKPGGLATFQLLSFIPLKYRLQPTRRVYGLLRRIGIGHAFLYERLKLTPIRSNYISEPRILALLKGLGARSLETQQKTIPETSVQSVTYFFTK